MPTQVLQAGPKAQKSSAPIGGSIGKAGRVKEAAATTSWALALNISLF